MKLFDSNRSLSAEGNVTWPPPDTWHIIAMGSMLQTFKTILSEIDGVPWAQKGDLAEEAQSRSTVNILAASAKEKEQLD